LTLIGHPTSLSLPLSLPCLATTRAFSSTLQACHIAEKDVQLLKKDMICHHAKFNPPYVNTAAFSPSKQAAVHALMTSRHWTTKLPMELQAAVLTLPSLVYPTLLG
jgi:hypothetical protein